MQFILEIVKKMKEKNVVGILELEPKQGCGMSDRRAQHGERVWSSVLCTDCYGCLGLWTCVRSLCQMFSRDTHITHWNMAQAQGSVLALLLMEMFALNLFLILSPFLHSVKWESHLGKVRHREFLTPKPGEGKRLFSPLS